MIPVIRRYQPNVDDAECARADALAAKLLNEQPSLRCNAALRPLAVTGLDDAPCLHLDDLTSISLIDRFHDVSFAEDRARLRACDSDLAGLPSWRACFSSSWNRR